MRKGDVVKMIAGSPIGKYGLVAGTQRGGVVHVITEKGFSAYCDRDSGLEKIGRLVPGKTYGMPTSGRRYRKMSMHYETSENPGPSVSVCVRESHGEVEETCLDDIRKKAFAIFFGEKE